jgi:hypothetical protein
MTAAWSEPGSPTPPRGGHQQPAGKHVVDDLAAAPEDPREPLRLRNQRRQVPHPVSITPIGESESRRCRSPILGAVEDLGGGGGGGSVHPVVEVAGQQHRRVGPVTSRTWSSWARACACLVSRQRVAQAETGRRSTRRRVPTGIQVPGMGLLGEDRRGCNEVVLCPVLCVRRGRFRIRGVRAVCPLEYRSRGGMPVHGACARRRVAHARAAVDCPAGGGQGPRRHRPAPGRHRPEFRRRWHTRGTFSAPRRSGAPAAVDQPFQGA